MTNANCARPRACWPTNRAPRNANPGQPGEERWIWLRMKLIADAGLVGLPNAGKSTFLSKVSAAKPKIADYPFTTLIPNLGIVYYGAYKSFVVADMPGLIEGAHTGKGLGTQFLRHIERTRVLVVLIDCTDEEPKEQYKILVHEMKSHNAEMIKKPQIVAITKMDIADDAVKKRIKKLTFGRGVPVIPISSATGEGLKELTDIIWKKLSK